MVYDVIIIGSGPAGLAAAIYGKRARLETLVLERQPMSGGQILNTYEVDNYPGFPGIGGFELGQKFREHAEKMGVEFVTAEVNGIAEGKENKRVLTEQGEYETKTIIFATGANHKKLGVPGEEELCGMGVSYCATCDGAFFRDGTVAVVGGGDVALEDALFLARTCKKVYLIHRRNEFRGAKVLQEQVKETENIEVIWDTIVEEIKGDGRVQSLALLQKKTGEESELPVDGVFLAVGIKPNTEQAADVVELDGSGYIIAGEDTKTSVRGIFAAGDVRTKPLRQVVTAVADGANAITAVESYLNGL